MINRLKDAIWSTIIGGAILGWLLGADSPYLLPAIAAIMVAGLILGRISGIAIRLAVAVALNVLLITQTSFLETVPNAGLWLIGFNIYLAYLVFRKPTAFAKLPFDEGICHSCNGSGSTPAGTLQSPNANRACGVCNGTGRVPLN
ncbi:hypothetical protein SLH49_10275 [Cognatiyoonia sp. IB215446]|uniref:hypothetical protein n=1 Tax=Cognatiyoonia sp. IB215446 TaxID=3097355 RepID=UPI002A0B18A8|nr:hypothetical protein [Cognatiyoonia sp. IB215446]MDX8348373.1 hypothetical protein [Cognatiyoonia sp. IB215446]